MALLILCVRSTSSSFMFSKILSFPFAPAYLYCLFEMVASVCSRLVLDFILYLHSNKKWSKYYHDMTIYFFKWLPMTVENDQLSTEMSFQFKLFAIHYRILKNVLVKLSQENTFKWTINVYYLVCEAIKVYSVRNWIVLNRTHKPWYA